MICTTAASGDDGSHQPLRWAATPGSSATRSWYSVDQAISTWPTQVRASAIVGYPDERLGEKACAFVVPDSDPAPSLEELTDYLRNDRRIAVHKLPERLELINELPLGATGKIQKFELRKIIVPAE